MSTCLLLNSVECTRVKGEIREERETQKPIINSRRVCANFFNIYCLMSIYINVYTNLPVRFCLQKTSFLFISLDVIFFLFSSSFSSSHSRPSPHSLPLSLYSYIDIDSIWNPRRTVCFAAMDLCCLKGVPMLCVALCVHIIWKTLISAEE